MSDANTAHVSSGIGSPSGEDGDPMLPIVNAIVATAASAALKRGSGTDVALGVIAGLRQLRTAADDEAGLTAVAAIDGMIRSRLLSENMTRLRAGSARPPAVTLPDPGRGVDSASIIFENAAESCLAVNAHAPDNGPLEMAVHALTGQLIEQLGGAPDWLVLKTALDRREGRHTSVRTSVLPDGGASIH